MSFKNGEGYNDPTAGEAMQKADRLPEHVTWFIETVKSIASLVGLEVVGKIHIRDKKTRRDYR